MLCGTIFSMNPEDIISVSQYLDRVNLKLKGERARILGEISGIQEYPGRSYLYFSVKDSQDQSTIKCFMWKRDYQVSGVLIKEGMEVVVSAYPSIYKPNGSISLQVESIELVGEGALKMAYEELKKKLQGEGLFADERKRQLPTYPQKIGVITSKSGAVINDFLSNIGKFGFEILFVDSKVEGQDAIKDLLSAVDTLSKKDLDVLVVMRGGGSLESFMAFNNEMLVRKIAGFPVPVITGIGHDKDLPLVSMVSDRNVSTPTAVANLLNSTWGEALAMVNLSEEKVFSQFSSTLKDKMFLIDNSEVLIQNRFTDVLNIFRKAEETLTHSVVRIESSIKRVFDTIDTQVKELMRGFGDFVGNYKDMIKQFEKTLELSSPEKQLSRGYSIVRKGGKVLKKVGDTKKGDVLDITMSDGIIKTITQ